MIPLYGLKLERGQETQADPSRAALLVACDGQPPSGRMGHHPGFQPQDLSFAIQLAGPAHCLPPGRCVVAFLTLPHPSSEEGAVQLAEAPGGELLAAVREQAGGGPALHSWLSHPGVAAP